MNAAGVSAIFRGTASRSVAGGLPVRVRRAPAVAPIVSAASAVVIAPVAISGRPDLAGAIIPDLAPAALLATAAPGLSGGMPGPDGAGHPSPGDRQAIRAPVGTQVPAQGGPQSLARST